MQEFIRNLFTLLRPSQWYKNLLILIPIIITGNLFFISTKTLLAFVALILISAANYIMNDILDKDRDFHHPKKSKRPISSKKIKASEVKKLFFWIVVFSLFISYIINLKFLYLALGIYGLTILYNFIFKKIWIIDLVSIAFLNTLRTYAGFIVLDIFADKLVLHWIFFLSLYIASGRRLGELLYLNTSAASHRIVFIKYNKQNLEIIKNIVYVIAIILYILVVFVYRFSSPFLYILTFLILISQFNYIAKKNNIYYREPEKALQNKLFAATAIIQCLAFFIISL